MRAVLLDGMGTLVALAPPWPIFAQRLHREHGIELTPMQARWAFAAEMAYYRAHHHEGRDARTLAALRARCAEVLCAALPAAAAAALTRAALTEAMLGSLRFSVYDDALVTLPLLRAQGMHVLVVSNWDYSLPQVLDALGLGGLIDGVFTSAVVGARKPSREIFQAALAQVGVSAAQALHVGDDLNEDVEGARAAGIAAVLLRREDSMPLTTDVPTIASLTDLAALL